MTRLAAITITLAALSTLLGACTTNQATGRRQLDYFSREDEIALGLEAGPQLTQEYGGAVTDAAINSYVTGVGMSMVPHTEGDYASLPWKFTLLNSDVINAFALPGGQVFISRGLAEKFENEAQLAGVLGHEIGHVTAEHADRSVQNQLPTLGVAAVGSVLAGNDETMQQAVAVLVSATGTFALKYSRDQENEADKLGMRYMTRAGYNPKGMEQVMQVLAKASEASGAPPEWQSTHPAPATRLGIIRERLATENYARVVNDPNSIVAPERYRAKLLEPLRSVPRAATPPARAGVIDLNHPESWCWHCARKAEIVALFASR
jgi:predicted Zn-dependent protease